MNIASSPALFAVHFGRLLSDLVHEPEDLDAQRQAVKELLSLNEDRVTLTWDNWRICAGNDVLEPTNAGILELVSRMAAHGIRELSFTPGTDRAHLVGVVGTLAQDPVIGDGGANVIARLGMLGADTVRVTPVVDPEKLAEIIGAIAPAIEAPQPASAQIVVVEAPKPAPVVEALKPAPVVEASSQTKVIHAVRPTEAAAAAPPASQPPVAAPVPIAEPASAQPAAPETIDVLLARLNAASDVKTITRALDVLASYT